MELTKEVTLLNRSSKFIRFIGGKNLAFSLMILILIGLTIIIFNKISFIFHPLIVILSTVLPPAILAFIAYYLLNPIVNLLEKMRIKRLFGIIIIIIVFSGIITLAFIFSMPTIEVQISKFIENFPIYLENINETIQKRSEEHTSELQSRGHLVCRHLF